MQNAKKIMMYVGSVFCFLSALFISTQSTAQKYTMASPSALVQLSNTVPVTSVTQSKRIEVAARFNFEHVRFEFIQLVNDSTLQTPNKRKRIAFSNLV